MKYTYNFDKYSCLYHKVCSLFDTEECNGACIRYMEFDYLLKTSNLPLKLQKPVKLYPENCDLKSFNFLNDLKADILDCVEEGIQLYIYSSTCGNGKTSWAVKLLLKYFDEVWNGNGFVTRGIFIHVPTFLNESKNFQNNANFLELKSLCEKVDLVVWDDIAANKLSSYEQNLLISLIDSRQNNQLANIFTSNITLDNLDNNVGQRLASRLVSGYKVVLRGHDMRRSEFNGNSTDFE